MHKADAKAKSSLGDPRGKLPDEQRPTGRRLGHIGSAFVLDDLTLAEPYESAMSGLPSQPAGQETLTKAMNAIGRLAGRNARLHHIAARGCRGFTGTVKRTV